MITLSKVDDPRPTIQTGKNTRAGVFGASPLTYNEAGITYNQIDAIYGGADRVTDTGPQISAGIMDVKPTIYKIENL